MISNETLKLVCDLLINLSECEKRVEINRQVLCQNLDFDAYQLFSFLDTESKNYLNEVNIINFLQKRNGIPCTVEEIQFFIFFYDENFDGKLSYSEFLNFVLSDNNYVLRKNARERVGTIYGKSAIPFNVEYSLVKLLQRELELIRKTWTIIAELKARYDFNIHDIFHYIKGYGCITPQSMKLFLQKNLIKFEEDDIRTILKRIDINRDSKVNFCEFHAFFCFPNLKCTCCSPCNCSCHNMNNIKNSNINNKLIDTLNNDINNFNENNSNDQNQKSILNIRLSPERTNKNINIKRSQNSYDLKDNIIDDSDNYAQEDTNSLSPSLKMVPAIKRAFSPNKNLIDINDNSPNNNSNLNAKNNISNNLYSSPINYNINNINNNISLNNSLNSLNNRNNNSNSKNNNSIRNNTNCILDKKQKCNYCKSYPCFCNQIEFQTAENNFLKYINKLIEIESRIEDAKINLVMHSDFNVEDVFRIFENPENEIISFSDLQKGLKQLGIFTSLKEIKLLMKRADTQNKGYIDYSNFFDLLVPFQKKYRDNVERRIPSSFIPTYNKSDIFLLSTKIYLVNLFRLIISCEDQINIIKENIVSINTQTERLFNKIDNSGLGFISDMELYIYLKNKGIICDELQNALIFIRLDKNRNGKIELWEMEEELSPY